MGAKQAEFNRIIRAVENLQSAGVAVNGCFILGADGETDRSIDQLIAFLETASFAEVQLTLQTPFPGTGLYNRLSAGGRLLKERDWSHDTLFDVSYQPDSMTPEQLETGFRRAVTAVFRPEATLRRLAIRDEIWRINAEHRL